MLAFEAAFAALADRADGRLAAFYRRWFDLAPAIDRPGRYVEFRLPGLRLGIFVPKPENAAEFAADRAGSLSLCLTVRDLDAAIASCRAAGATTGPVAIASHGRECYAYDPAGNRWILYEPNEPDPTAAEASG